MFPSGEAAFWPKAKALEIGRPAVSNYVCHNATLAFPLPDDWV